MAVPLGRWRNPDRDTSRLRFEKQRRLGYGLASGVVNAGLDEARRNLSQIRTQFGRQEQEDLRLTPRPRVPTVPFQPEEGLVPGEVSAPEQARQERSRIERVQAENRRIRLEDLVETGQVNEFYYQNDSIYRSAVDQFRAQQATTAELPPRLEAAPGTAAATPTPLPGTRIQPTREEVFEARGPAELGTPVPATLGEAEQISGLHANRYPGVYTLPKAIEGRFNIPIPYTGHEFDPGRVAREVTYLDPINVVTAATFGPSTFRNIFTGRLGRALLGPTTRRTALGTYAKNIPTRRDITGVAATAVGADIVPGVAELGRAVAPGVSRLSNRWQQNLQTALEREGALASEYGFLALPRNIPMKRVRVANQPVKVPTSWLLREQDPGYAKYYDSFPGGKADEGLTAYYGVHGRGKMLTVGLGSRGEGIRPLITMLQEGRAFLNANPDWTMEATIVNVKLGQLLQRIGLPVTPSRGSSGAVIGYALSATKDDLDKLFQQGGMTGLMASEQGGTLFGEPEEPRLPDEVARMAFGPNEVESFEQEIDRLMQLRDDAARRGDEEARAYYRKQIDELIPRAFEARIRANPEIEQNVRQGLIQDLMDEKQDIANRIRGRSELDPEVRALQERYAEAERKIQDLSRGPREAGRLREYTPQEAAGRPRDVTKWTDEQLEGAISSYERRLEGALDEGTEDFLIGEVNRLYDEVIRRERGYGRVGMVTEPGRWERHTTTELEQLLDDLKTQVRLGAPAGEYAKQIRSLEDELAQRRGDFLSRLAPEGGAGHVDLDDFLSRTKVELPGGGVRAVAGMDPALIRHLGKNMYQGDPGQISVKEMLQNAVDATRDLGKAGRVEVDFNPEKRTIKVVDNGHGMTTDVATKEFVDIGGSLKEAEQSSGGWGVAKVAIFINSDDIEVHTWRNGVETILKGSGTDWIDANKGLAVTTKKAPVGKHGTSIAVKLRKDLELDDWYTGQFMQKFLDEHQLEQGFTMRLKDKYSTVPRDMTGNRTRMVKARSVPFKGGVIDFYLSSDTTKKAWADISVLNKGLPQFALTENLGESVQVPTRIIADVRAKGGPDVPHYPFTPDRESLKREAKGIIEDFVTGIRQEAAGEEMEIIRKAFQGAPKTRGRLSIIDTTGRLDPTFAKSLARAGWVDTMLRGVPAVHQRIWDALDRAWPYMPEVVHRMQTGRGGRVAQARFAGIGLGDDYLGASIQLDTFIPGNPDEIVIQPFMIQREARGRGITIYGDQWLDWMSDKLLSTMVHENAHSAARGHKENFTSAITWLLAELGPDYENLRQSIRQNLSRLGPGGFDEYVAASEEYFRQLERANARGQNIVGRATDSVKPLEPGGLRGEDISGATGRERRGRQGRVPRGRPGEIPSEPELAPGARGALPGVDPLARARREYPGLVEDLQRVVREGGKPYVPPKDPDEPSVADLLETSVKITRKTGKPPYVKGAGGGKKPPKKGRKTRQQPEPEDRSVRELEEIARTGRGDISNESFVDLIQRINASKNDELSKRMANNALIKVLSGERVGSGEQRMLGQLFPKSKVKKNLQQRKTLPRRTYETGLNLANVPRAIQSSFDASAPLRQALVLTVGRTARLKKEPLVAFAYMMRAFVDPEIGKVVDEMIDQSPYKSLKKELYRAKHGDELTKQEEALMGSELLHEIPVIGAVFRRSNEAYRVYLNKLRSDVFDETAARWLKAEDDAIKRADQARQMGRTPPRIPFHTQKDFDDLARHINYATGRGGLGKFEAGGPLLNAAFFSPRLLLSRAQIPLNLLFSSRAARGEILADVLGTIIPSLSFLLLMKYSGAADVNLDPRSPDFGKLKIGDQRIDFWGGYQQIVRYAAQVATGLTTNDYQPEEVMLRFLRSKLAPVPGLATDIVTEETFLGEEIPPTSNRDVLDQALNRLTPLFIQDMWESIKHEGVLGGLRATPGFFGVTVSAYPERISSKLFNIPQYEGIDRETQRKILGRGRPGDPDYDPGFFDRVTEYRDSLVRDKGLTDEEVRSIPWVETARYVAEVEGLDESFLNQAIVLHSPAMSRQFLNPEWLQFVIDNEDVLSEEVGWIFNRELDEFLNRVRLERAASQ